MTKTLMNAQELICRDGRKSFYGKAWWDVLPVEEV